MATHDGMANLVNHDDAVRTEARVQPLNRRRALRMLGVLATAAACAAAQATRPEEASATSGGGDQGFLALGSNPWYIAGVPGANTPAVSSAPTVLRASPNFGNFIDQSPDPVLLEVDARPSSGTVDGLWGLGAGNASNGVFGSGGDAGVVGSGGTYGVYGTSNTYGVFGSSTNYGVFGLSTKYGVYGLSSGKTGVIGISDSGIGVQGQSSGSSNTSPGVYGLNTGGGPAIVGQATGSGFGFSAITVSGTGCFGGASSTGTGVYAYSVGGPALVAFAAGGSNLAGYFNGPIYVTGSMTVLGAKSAAVRAADGRLRRLYSMESPESWFEDFGKGELKGGSATIQLEPGFAGVVHGDNYHVFLTPRGESKWLYVSKQSPDGFTVQEGDGGTSNVGFSYRIVAKRKDIAGARLEQVDEPPTLEVPAFPKLPAVPPVPEAPRGHGPER